MGVFKLGKMTFGSLFKKPETVLYPIEKKPQPIGLKGHIVNVVEDCILCGICEKGCPTDCITVDKASRTWSLLPLQCIQCGYCTQVCPKKCLQMDPNYWTASTSKEANVFVVPDKDAKPAAAAIEEPKAEAKPELEAEQPKQADAQGGAPVESGPRPIDLELEAKIKLLDADKAARVREALASR